jgi:large subunit ribosomal protein L13e
MPILASDGRITDSFQKKKKEAKIPRKFALSIGIPVDHRRSNTSVESLQANVSRLNEYKSKLILFPRKAKKPKSGDSSIEEIKAAVQLVSVAPAFPIDSNPGRLEVAERTITEAERSRNVFRELRLARADARNAGAREKRQKAKDEEAATKKK